LTGADNGALRYDLLEMRKGSPTGIRRVSGTGRIVDRVTPGRTVVAGGQFRLPLSHTDASGPTAQRTATIDASSDELAVGDYLLVLTYEAGANSVTDSVRFAIRWIDMPLTLTRIEYAIKVLYPIATDATIDSLTSGDADEQQEALLRFWTPRDPTPGTSYNEAMAEYYRRADYALFNFNSVGQRDGAFSDRGKIYMLYGPPTEVSRDMQPETPPREIWIYRNAVNRRFIFTDDSRSGEYRLVEYHDL
jgi:GWxTD domain-containing protein